MKSQTQKTLQLQNRQYRTDLEANYFIPMIEACTREFKKIIEQRFCNYHTLRNKIESLINQKREQKKVQLQVITQIKDKIEKVRLELDFLQTEMGSISVEKRVD